MAKVSSDFSRHVYSDEGLYTKAGTIADALADNPYFPTLKEKSVAIKALNTTYGDLLKKVENGNKQVTAEKKQARTAVEEILHYTAANVQEISAGDEVKILSSGFDTNQPSAPVGVLDQVENVKVKLGIVSRTLDITWDVVAHARSYEIRYIKYPKTDSSVVNVITSTKHSVTIEGLDLGSTYIIQIAAVGSDPKRVWSVEVISCYVS